MENKNVLNDKELQQVNGGMKVVVDDEQSWWRSILNFFFKIKN